MPFINRRQIGTHDLRQIRTARQLERVQVAEMSMAVVPARDDEARVVQYGDVCPAMLWVSVRKRVVGEVSDVRYPLPAGGTPWIGLVSHSSVTG